MPSYKLTYFDGRGRGETTRMLFSLGGIPFEDKRIQFADWPALKPNTPWGTLPMLEVDGKPLGQSLAVARYVAKQAGLAGKTPIEAAKVDAVADSISEIMDKFFPTMFINEEDKKAAALKEFNEKTLSVIGGNIEKFLCGNNGGKGFIVGDSMTFADAHFFIAFEYLSKVCPEEVKKLPKLCALFERMKSDAKVADYLKKRPETSF